MISLRAVDSGKCETGVRYNTPIGNKLNIGVDNDEEGILRLTHRNKINFRLLEII